MSDAPGVPGTGESLDSLDRFIATLGGIIGGGMVAVFLLLYFKTGRVRVYRP